LRDIHAQLGTDQYWRLRIGIGHPGVKSEVANWVLKKPAPDQRTAIVDCITRTSLALPHLLSGDMVKATQMIHTAKPPRPKPPRPAALSGTEKTEAKDGQQPADLGNKPR
jgi:PTH1 family peptidyl-tRNA hydrolase